MAQINIDTDMSIECGNNIINLAKDYNKTIKALFNRLSKVNSNGEWTGNSAAIFIEQVKKDQDQYLQFGNELKKCGQVIVSSSSKISRIANKNIL